MSATAFFDLDYTLLDTSSGLLYIQEVIRQRRAPLWLVGRIGLAYQLKLLDFGQAHADLIRWVGRPGRAKTQEFFHEWIPRRLLPRLTPAGLAKIEWHRQQGHRVVILSASIEEIVQPVAGHLGLGRDYLCTHLGVEDGRYSGKLDGPLCYGSGKVYWAKRWLAENEIEPPGRTSYFYTDSSSDLPLLEMVSHPVAVNPSRKLASIARVRGWPIERFY